MEQSREELWPYFTDPDVLAECAPGCKEMVLESPHEITAVLAVGVGSVKPEFNVDAIVTELEYPEKLVLKAEGNAPRNEFEMTATMEMIEQEDGGTTVAWEAKADVSGTIVSLGGRALKSVTNRLVKKYFADMQAAVEAGEGAESKLEAAPPEALEDFDIDLEEEAA
ncbi:carbon monoxide dehydrogenase [Natronorubrum sp. JWXQ-INN-674]|uniref:Carbon monoxide dehydrogenase n=1 Tax=Natronorubrum halalkaliphilum TaxID=2691917 RepID=A0A6B0VM22_9EURY|nr:SRPBCC domain-containing protein [Natronorubrum halalkaliphilum]MXV62630.1 carbon monoxide dehydrogenase [Natronorubrum halalkaliphilum]